MQPHYPLDATKPIDPSKLKPLWKQVSQDLRKDLGDPTFDLWFADFRLTSAGPEGVILLAPGSMYLIWVEENFKESLGYTFEKYLTGCGPIRCELATEEELAKDAEKASQKARKKKNEVTELRPRVLVEEISEAKLLERGRAAGLVETFRFDNFVSGENSELAWAAAQAVAVQPGKTYQPLFFHSACGLGKTHLLHGIGWESLRLRPKSKIIFVTAERFANDYIDGIQKSSLSPFRKKYRQADLLLIDDVQFLGRKEGLQREFFHTFNSLSDLHKQIVLASDCPASEINELEDRLVSRFQWGLSVEIHRPGLETRAAILRRKRDDWNMTVSDEIIDSIVERVRGNVRVLEGALIRVAMVATMNDEPIAPEAIDEVLADICGGDESQQIGIKEIKQAVAEHYDLEVQILNGKKRTARVAEARQVAMYLVRRLTDLSLVEIASSFGKDHGTVIYAVKRIKAKCEASAALKSTVELIKRRLVQSSSTVGSKRPQKVSQTRDGLKSSGVFEGGEG
ncbi:MAG: chromosomal replication initiator protein DnaA [Verrucomicrobiales bacterium]